MRSPDGATATADVRLGADPRVTVEVWCGRVLDEVVLRSYCVGAAHMALGWVTSEGLAVDEAGAIHDLTIRSFGVLRAVDMPPVDVAVGTGEAAGSGSPVNGSDAVFAAVASTLYIPLTLVALGIIARGAAFAFRKVSDEPRLRRLFGAAFAFSSVATPLFLGAIAGAIASGRVPPGIAAAAPALSTGLSLSVGSLAEAARIYFASQSRGFRNIFIPLPDGKPKAEQVRLHLRLTGATWRLLGVELPQELVRALVKELPRGMS